MKKAVLVLILILGTISGVFSQTSAPMDLVLILDTSSSMSNFYRETSDYLVGNFLREFLRFGDTFHLISFASSPKVEISRRIEGIGDVETVAGRLLLMYPLDPESNVSGALTFAENYASSLPGTRHRKLVLITDGDAPDTQALVDASSARLRSGNADLQFIKVPVTGTGPSSGRAPNPPPATAQQQPAPRPVATPPATAPAASPAPAGVQPPANSQTQQPQAARPSASSQTQTPPAAQTGQTSQPRVAAGQTSPGPEPESAAPPPVTPPPGAQTPGRIDTGTSQSEVPFSTPGNQPVSQYPLPSQTAPVSQPPDAPAPQISAPPPQEVSPSTAERSPVTPPMTQPVQSGSRVQTSQPQTGSDGGIPLLLIIFLALLALLILFLIIFFVTRKLHSSPNRVMAQAASPMDARGLVEAERQGRLNDAEMMDRYAEAQRKSTGTVLSYPPPERKPMPKDTVYESYNEENDGPLMLNLFVEDQNTAIGRRNIHVVKGGYNFSVGGGKSDFLIFLVPVPPHIADVHFDGRNCTFTPRKPQYFPDIGSQTVSNCIGKTIRVISDKNYELFIRIERYQDPLKALNRMLRSITVPGEVR